jgi:hypothetical protein
MASRSAAVPNARPEPGQILLVIREWYSSPVIIPWPLHAPFMRPWFSAHPIIYVVWRAYHAEVRSDHGISADTSI